MCLITADKEPLIAEEDILVYKWLSFNKRAPFTGYKYHWGKNVARPCEESWHNAVTVNEDGKFCINGGWLHAFNPKTCGEIDFSLFQKSGERIEKMYIPKGTEYYIGERNDICAKVLEWRKGPRYILRKNHR